MSLLFDPHTTATAVRIIAQVTELFGSGLDGGRMEVFWTCSNVFDLMQTVCACAVSFTASATQDKPLLRAVGNSLRPSLDFLSLS